MVPPYVIFALLPALFPTFCRAGNAPFLWKWGDDALVGKSIPTCDALPVGIIPANESSTGTPPYYMLAYPLEGTPRVYTLGADPNKLQWTPDYAPQTQMLLQVVDSHGISGGIEPRPFLSVDGKSTDCVIKDDSGPHSDFTLTANLTGPHDDLRTCEFWGLIVKGGTWPYTFSLIAAGSEVVTNVTTVTSDQDELIYVNRADPGRLFLVAASDSTGKYAYANVSIQTSGSSDVTCRGRGTSFGNSTQIAAQEKQRLENEAQEASNKRTKIIVGAIVVIIVVLLLGGLLFWFMRRRNSRNRRKSVDLVPRVFDQGHSPAYSSIDFDPYSGMPHSGTISPYPKPSGYHRRQSSNVPLMGRSKREEMARYSDSQQMQQMNSRTSDADGRGDTHHTGSRTRQGDGDEDEIVIQHRDGGAVNVREVPPSYADLLGTSPGPVPLLHVASGSSISLTTSGPDHSGIGSTSRLVPEKRGYS